MGKTLCFCNHPITNLSKLIPFSAKMARLAKKIITNINFVH